MIPSVTTAATPLGKPVKLKKCPKCGSKKPATNEFFDVKQDSADGLQSYCKACKSELHRRKRQVNITFRIRHHFTTRIRDQLGVNCPEVLGRKELNELLGYKIADLRKYLDQLVQRDHNINIRIAMTEGYHIDHIKPLVSFHCTEVESPEGLKNFRDCWAISNLELIPAEENLAKGAKYNGS